MSTSRPSGISISRLIAALNSITSWTSMSNSITCTIRIKASDLIRAADLKQDGLLQDGPLTDGAYPAEDEAPFSRFSPTTTRLTPSSRRPNTRTTHLNPMDEPNCRREPMRYDRSLISFISIMGGPRSLEVGDSIAGLESSHARLKPWGIRRFLIAMFMVILCCANSTIAEDRSHTSGCVIGDQ